MGSGPWMFPREQHSHTTCPDIPPSSPPVFPVLSVTTFTHRKPSPASKCPPTLPGDTSRCEAVPPSLRTSSREPCREEWRELTGRASMRCHYVILIIVTRLSTSNLQPSSQF